MEPTTSFIPKKSLDTTSTARSSSSVVSLLTLLSTLIFLGTLVVAVGVFFYQKSLSNTIETDKANLTQREKLFDPDLIKQFQQLDSKLKAVNTLLANHVRMSHIFELLQLNTIKSVHFTRFSYETTADAKNVRILLGGQAKDYASVALQADYFGGNSSIQSYDFSNLTLDAAGNVLFDVVLTIDRSLLTYESQPTVVVPQPALPATATPVPQTEVVPPEN